jgi:hypothetical protein
VFPVHLSAHGKVFFLNGLQITRVILYVKQIPKVAALYDHYLGMRRLPGATEGWVESEALPEAVGSRFTRPVCRRKTVL